MRSELNGEKCEDNSDFPSELRSMVEMNTFIAMNVAFKEYLMKNGVPKEVIDDMQRNADEKAIGIIMDRRTLDS